MIQDILSSLKDYVAICNAMCYVPSLVENEQLQSCTYFMSSIQVHVLGYLAGYTPGYMPCFNYLTPPPLIEGMCDIFETFQKNTSCNRRWMGLERIFFFPPDCIFSPRCSCYFHILLGRAYYEVHVHFEEFICSGNYLKDMTYLFFTVHISLATFHSLRHIV